MYSIVALRTFVLAFVSNELLPKRRVFIKTGSQRSKRFCEEDRAQLIQCPNHNYRTDLENLENYV